MMSRAELLLIAAAVSLTAQTGKWYVWSDKSAMDDSQGVYLKLASDSKIEVWPWGSHTPELFIRCKEKRTELYVVTGTAASVEAGREYGVASARIRIDQQPAQSITISQSTDSKALFVRQPLPIIKAMLPAKQLLFEFTPFQKNPQTVTFQINGLAEAIKPLRSACGW